jgi:hypothetical protein
MTIKNVSNSTVVIVLPDCNFRKEMRPGGFAILDQVQENCFNTDPGCLELVENGFLIESDVSAAMEKRKIAEMLIPTGGDAKFITITPNEIDTFFKTATIEQFTKALVKGSPATKDLISTHAVKICENNPARVALIKKYCQVDPIQAYALMHSEEKAT